MNDSWRATCTTSSPALALWAPPTLKLVLAGVVLALVIPSIISAIGYLLSIRRSAR